MDRIKQLASEIEKHKKSYYSGNEQIMDAEYDRLEAELRILDPENPVLRQIGDNKTGKGGFPKIKHRMVVGSLYKAADKSEFWNWFKKYCDERIFICEEKIDGSSLELQYDNGKLSRIVTRGNGRVGEDVYNTAQEQKIGQLPQMLKTNLFTGAIRGEVVLKNSVFREKYAGENANPRNTCAGIIKRKDGIGCEDLIFIAYDVYPPPGPFEYDKIKFLGKNKFILPKYQLFNRTGDDVKNGSPMLYGDICAFRDDMQSLRGDEVNGSDYNYDGIVVKRNTLNAEDAERDYPNFQIAFKFDLDIAVSEVTNVIWYANGKTRTPVVEFNPVQLHGTTVKHALLYNPRIFRNHDIRMGSVVHVTKGGEIIPKIIKTLNNEKSGKKFKIPEICEFCKTKLVETDAELYCPNKNCSSTKLHAVAKWIKVHEIMYLGDASLLSLMQSNLVKDSADLYSLTPTVITEKTDIGSAMALKICQEIQTVGKETTIPKFIGGLDIPNIDRQTVKLIVKHWNCKSLNELLSLEPEKILEVKGIGESTVSSFVTGLAENKILIAKLASIVNFKDSIDTPGRLFGKTIVITGVITGMTRDTLQKKIEASGGNVSNTVSKSVSFLVTDENNISLKRSKAEKLGIPIITSSKLIEML
jgi:DNA ligase (NAD+)